MDELCGLLDLMTARSSNGVRASRVVPLKLVHPVAAEVDGWIIKP